MCYGIPWYNNFINFKSKNATNEKLTINKLCLEIQYCGRLNKSFFLSISALVFRIHGEYSEFTRMELRITIVTTGSEANFLIALHSHRKVTTLITANINDHVPHFSLNFCSHWHSLKVDIENRFASCDFSRTYLGNK